jgi:hypothetical protein
MRRIALFLLVIVLAACEVPIINPLVGKWQTTFIFTVTWTFNADLTVIQESTGFGGDTVDSGTYTYTSTELTVVWNDGSANTEAYYSIESGGNILRLTPKNGGLSISYSRI